MASIAAEHSAPWQGLGVALLHRLVIETLLSGKDLPKPKYVHTVDEVVESLDTGDVGAIDANGFIHITDRAKDLIKSGGEWISSVELENAALLHPAVQEAAAIAAADAKWGERPLMVLVLKPCCALTQEELAAHLAARVPRWWLPDAVVFAGELPHTATGKVNKARLREQYQDWSTKRGSD